MVLKERAFDTKLQQLKYRILKTVAKYQWQGTLIDHIWDIPSEIVTGKVPTMRCCIYKEKAIAARRVKLAMGGDKENKNIIEVIDIACDECPAGGYEVSNACRGCIAHRCSSACKMGAITYDDNHAAHINKKKCINCGKCADACPYDAIVNHIRPCQKACTAGAIDIHEEGYAVVQEEKCIGCGRCVFKCPFGAIMDKSFICDCIDLIKESQNGGPKVYAVVAPAVSSQFSYASVGQVVAGLYELGFDYVVEAALGADLVALDEAKELVEKGFLTSSCCPAFVDYIKKNFPELTPYISSNPSPMVAISKFIKSKDPDAKVVFVGPCIAKKKEALYKENRPYVDCVITFEELQALFDSKEIEISDLEEKELLNASYFGRIFARLGGLSEAVVQSLKEQKIDFEVKPEIVDGIINIKPALLKKSKGLLDANFIEGMICHGGCIHGPGNLNYAPKDKLVVDGFATTTKMKGIQEAAENKESSIYNNK